MSDRYVQIAKTRTGEPHVLFVATTPFAVNAFLASHFDALAKQYKITLCVNSGAYELLPRIRQIADVVDIGFERKISPLKDLRSLIQLVAVVHRVRPLAIHSITPKAGLLAMLAGFLAGVPNRWHTFTGQVWATRRALSRLLLKTIDRLIVVLSTQVFADSASQCRFLQDERIVSGNGISVLGFGSIAGVDTERFHPDESVKDDLRNELGCGKDSCVFLFVGRLARDKGVFDLMSAYCRMAASTPDVELWMVGPDEEGLLPELQNASRAYSASIRWLGATPTPEKFMMAADVLVLPSYREGFGSVVIEAAACATPALAYRIDGIVDAVMDNETGLLVPVGNVGALVSAMLQLCEDRDLLQQLGEQACARARRDFASDSVTAAWAEFYHTQLQAR